MAPFTPPTPLDPPPKVVPEAPPIVGVGSPWAPADGENRDRILDWWRAWFHRVFFQWTEKTTDNLNDWITDASEYISLNAKDGNSWWITATPIATTGTTTVTIPLEPNRALQLDDLVSDTSSSTHYGQITALIDDTHAEVEYVGSLQGVPGPNTIPTDTAIAGYITTAPSETKTALDAQRTIIYGLIPDDSTADTKTANANILQAAMVSGATVAIPRGEFYTDPITIVGPIDITGASSDKTILRNDTGGVLIVSGRAVNVSKLALHSDGGGHTVMQAASISQGHWDLVSLYQTAPGYSVWDNAKSEYVDMRITRFYSHHVQTATVPAWNLVAAGGVINDNVWEKGRLQNSGNYHFWLESTTANAQYGAAFRDLTWEVCTGGLIRLISIRQYLIENGINWDMDSGSGGVTTLQKHGIYATANTYGIPALGVIRNQSRLAGTLEPGIVDLKLPSSGLGSGTIIEACRNTSTGDPYKVAAENSPITALGATPSLTDITGDDRTITTGSAGVAVGTAQTVRTGRGITASRPNAGTAGDGALFYDTTLERLVVSDGSDWAIVPTILKGVVQITWPSIPAHSTADKTVSVPGALISKHAAIAHLSTPPKSGLMWGAYVAANDTVTVRLANVTTSAITPNINYWYFKLLL